jgi:hypothetical protein
MPNEEDPKVKFAMSKIENVAVTKSMQVATDRHAEKKRKKHLGSDPDEFPEDEFRYFYGDLRK